MNFIDWPELRFADWEKTCDTVHMWTQIVGKTRLAMCPLENHWWNVAFYVTPRGLTTSSMPWAGTSFEIEFDFISHVLLIRLGDGRKTSVALAARPVAEFYAEYMNSLKTLGIEVSIHRKPVEFDEVIPFDEDRKHASYDKEYVDRFRRILINADRVLKLFRSRFTGKSSPVHFFWGSMDLAVTRFSGRPHPQPASADKITQEAYSHEVISCGFWPGDRRFPHSAFYAYGAPAPPGLQNAPIQPPAAYWDTQLGEFILKYEDVRASANPDQSILEFCQTTYEAGAQLARWNRQALERI
jgi:hypothetical protein